MASQLSLQGCLQALSGTTLDAQGAAQALMDAVAEGSAASIESTYTPTLTAIGANPVLGTGGVATGVYWERDTHVWVEVWIKFGTAAASFGDGVYSVSLPVAAAVPLRTGGEMPIGVGWAMPIVVHYFHTVELATTTTVVMRTGGNGELMVGAAIPAAWGLGGEMTLAFDYRSAA